mmetsp:Transcript_28181/g.39644  ORF Transcript_28181/g.39644 Transcript_28181/m.39644 type:complete len:155 (-) Transcript_28181:353-817(-)
MTATTKRQRRLGSVLRLFLVVLSFLSSVKFSNGTDVKWTPANNDDKDNRAATAPRSQKYWDEHGIERPDYAKTDAEIAFERGETSSTSKKIFWLGAFLAIVGFAIHQFVGPIPLVEGGSRLGGNYPWMDRLRPRTNFEEETRKARLSRFEQKQE